MNKNDIIKWVLIAGAAYLVYRYLQGQGMLGGKPQAEIAPGEKTEEKAALPPPPAEFVDITADKLQAYATSRMPPTWDGRLTISEWNWMTSQMTGKQQTTTLPGGSEPIYVAEYLALRKGAGISGLMQAFGSYQMASGWQM